MRPGNWEIDRSHPLAQGLQSLYTFDLPCAMTDRVQLGMYKLNGWSNPSNAILRNNAIGRGVIRTDQAGCIVNMLHPGMAASGGAVSLWAYTRSGGFGTVYGKIFNDIPKLGIFFNNTRVGFSACGVNITNGNVVDIGHSHFSWSHFCINWGPTGSFVYHHGELVATNIAPTFDYPAFSTPFCNQADGIRTFNGEMADLAFFNRTLSPAEIAILADRTDPMLGGLIVEERPVLYFDMGGGAGVDNLTASHLVTGSPVLGSPALSQVHALTATGITTSAPVLGTPVVGQIHSLTASALAVGSPVLDTPSLSENAADVDALTAVGLVVGSPVLGTPSLGQIHILGSDGLVTGPPVLGSPSITQIHTLEAIGLTVGAPVLGTPALNGSDIVLITAAEVARIVRATSRMKTVTASARVKQVRYEVTRA